MAVLRALALFCLATAACGIVRKARVADGETVEPKHKYPWIVHITSTYRFKHKGVRETQSFSCTGSIIDRFWSVATAAHCVPAREKCVIDDDTTKSCTLDSVNVAYRASLFSLNMTEKRVDKVKGNIIRYRHPLWRNPWRWLTASKKRHIWGDIALIFLSTYQMSPMSCSKASMPQPIKLAKIGKSNDCPKDGNFAGYGSKPSGYNPINGKYRYAENSELTEIPLKFKAYDDPSQGSETSSCKIKPMFHAYSEPNMMSSLDTLRHKNVMGTCEGDSGGPYMVKDHPGMRLRGILHGGHPYEGKNPFQEHPCNTFGYPNYFTDVNYKHIRRWLENGLKARYNKMKLAYSRSQIPVNC